MFSLYDVSVFLYDALINFYVVITESYSLWNGFFECKLPTYLFDIFMLLYPEDPMAYFIIPFLTCFCLY